MAHALSEVEGGASTRWSDLWVRSASAAILAPVALLCLWFGGWAWDVLIAVAMGGLGYEWGLLGKRGHAAVLSAALLAVWLCGALGGFAAGLLAVAVIGAAITWRLGKFAGAGLPYAGFGGISLLWLRLQPQNGLLDTLFLVLVIWSTDIGAYLAGRVFGGPKLAPKISPGKTWSGSVGGLLAGGFAGGALAGGGHSFDFIALPAGFLLSVFAQSGDLLESAIKRKLCVKDSGRTIPGHGGLFDRLDGFLAATPVAAVLAFSVHGGLPLWG